MLNPPDPPAVGIVADAGLNVNVQDPAACVTVNVRPAIVIVPDRSTVKLLACTVYPTVPDPLPAAPKEIVIQVLLLTAVRAEEHPTGEAVMAIWSLPPEAGKFACEGAIV